MTSSRDIEPSDFERGIALGFVLGILLSFVLHVVIWLLK